MKKIPHMILSLAFLSMHLLCAQNYKINGNTAKRLDGTWIFYWNKLVTTINDDITGESVTVPSTWKEYKYGYGTYCCSVVNLDPDTEYAFLIYESPGTASAAYINGVYASSCGTVSTTRQSDACCKPWLVPVLPDKNGRAVIAIQVSNWVYRKAGMWSNVYFGTLHDMKWQFNMRSACSAFVLGMVLFIFIVNMLLFLFNHERKDSFLFSLIALMLAARLLTAEFSVLLTVWPSFPYQVARKLEYCIIWAGPPVFLYLLDSVYADMHLIKGVHRYIPLLSLLLGVLCTCLPLSIASMLVMPMILMAFIIVAWILYCIVKNREKIKQDERDLLITLFVILVIVVTGLTVTWLLTMTNRSLKMSLVPLFFMMFSLMQFYNMSSRQSVLFQRRMQKSCELKKLNDAYARFVPKEFLGLLHKNDVTEVMLGDNAAADISIAFFMLKNEADMEEQFVSLAEFSDAAVRVVSKNNGFLSKFINHGLMALFPHDASDAVRCALELKTTAMSLGIEGVGCGIHFGRMIVGTIGEENRLDDTVISDTVNTAFRIMEFSMSHDIAVVASSEIAHRVLDTDKEICFEKIGEIPVKGKKDPVLMYSCSLRETMKGAAEK